LFEAPGGWLDWIMPLLPHVRPFARHTLVPFVAVLLLAACSGSGHRSAAGGTAPSGGAGTPATTAAAATGEATAGPQATPSPALTASLRPGSAPSRRATPARGGGSGSTAQASATPGEPLSPGQLLRRDAVPTIQECIDAGIGPCYSPADITAAYDLDALHDAGIDGAGQSVVIVVSFGSPTLADDVAAFSKAMGLPDADLQELYPLGSDFSGQPQDEISGWRGETTLDAEWIHAIAPKARIVVLVSPVAETEGVVGLPEMLELEQYALDNHLGTVISQSWGTSEDLLDDAEGLPVRQQWDAFYQHATAAGITIITASGDHGALADLRNEQPGTTRSADWPSAEPTVTTVGGTTLTLNADGSYGSERVWASSGGAAGSGVSRFYAEPAYQSGLPDAVQKQLGGMRGEADVAAIADGLLVYYAHGAGGQAAPHPEIVGGTSASTPIWAGIVALADQMAGHGLGNINPTLYQLGAAGRCFHDVTQGSNAFRRDPGEPATPGWDFPTGWGSPDAACLVPALAGTAQGGG
jgi:subtilase family serine protease